MTLTLSSLTAGAVLPRRPAAAWPGTLIWLVIGFCVTGAAILRDVDATKRAPAVHELRDFPATDQAIREPVQPDPLAPRVPAPLTALTAPTSPERQGGTDGR